MDRTIEFLKQLELAETNLIFLVIIAFIQFIIAFQLGKIIRGVNGVYLRYTDITNAINAAHYEDAKDAVKMEAVEPKSEPHQIFVKTEGTDRINDVISG